MREEVRSFLMWSLPGTGLIHDSNDEHEHNNENEKVTRYHSYH